MDFKDDDGLTALHFATIGNFLDCVQLLVKEGALIESEDNRGRNAIIWAFMQGI